MKIDLRIECERCKKEEFIHSDKVDSDVSIIGLIHQHSPYKRVDIFGIWLLICPRCQENYEDTKRQRRKEEKNFIDNM